MRVLGLDMSLTGTGVALIDSGQVEPKLGLIKSMPTPNSLDYRAKRMEGILKQIPFTADLILIEGPSFGSKGGSNWDRAGLWWQVVAKAEQHCVPVVEVPPTVLKKWATGKGGAGKMEVGIAISKMWPELSITDDNIADALCLAHIGAQHIGIEVPRKAHHESALVKVQWRD